MFVATTIVGLAYIHCRKRKISKAVLKIHWESLLIRSFATAISVSSVLVQISSFQPFSPLQEAGIGQLYITVGILTSLGILVSNLKQKLDSFVLPPQEGQPEQPPILISGKRADEFLPPLRHFITRWDQYLLLGGQRWHPENRKDMQSLAHNISSQLLDLDSQHPNLLRDELRKCLHVLSQELRQFAVARISSREDLEEMEIHGSRAYELSKSLISSLELKKAYKPTTTVIQTLQLPGIDPVAIAHKCVQERWGRDVRIVRWPMRPEIAEEGDRIIVSGTGIDDQQRSHTYRVPMTKDGKIIYDEVLAT